MAGGDCDPSQCQRDQSVHSQIAARVERVALAVVPDDVDPVAGRAWLLLPVDLGDALVMNWPRGVVLKNYLPPPTATQNVWQPAFK